MMKALNLPHFYRPAAPPHPRINHLIGTIVVPTHWHHKTRFCELHNKMCRWVILSQLVGGIEVPVHPEHLFPLPDFPEAELSTTQDYTRISA